jgi:quinol monooxygenase YgiN
VIIGVGDIYTQIPRRDAVRALMSRTEANVRQQPGCISYVFAETLDDPGHFVVVQQWRDQAAVEEHYRSPAFLEYQEQIADLLVRSSELRLHSVAESFRPVDPSVPSAPATQED